MLFYRKYFGPQQKYCVQVSDVPGVVRLLDYVETRDSYYIVMETHTRSIDLFDFISAAGTLPEDVAREIFGQVSCDWLRPGHVTQYSPLIGRQVVEAVLRCRDLHVLHGDVKDENVLMDLDTGTARLIDFGSGSWAPASSASSASSASPALYTEYEGTRVYAPPEWLLHRQYSGEDR